MIFNLPQNDSFANECNDLMDQENLTVLSDKQVFSKVLWRFI